jgi:hypothetical protein
MAELIKDVPAEYKYLHDYTKPVKYAEREIIGREREMHSILAAFERPELCNVILLGEAGSGKGHPNDTLLPSPNGGYIRVGDIQVGDFVYGEDGKPVKVIGVYPQGPKRVYKVTFSDGSSVFCNDEHIWNVRNRRSHYDDRPYQNMTLRDMMDIGIHDEQMRPEGRMMKVNHWYIPIGQAVQRDDACLPIDPYVLGVMIGDGCLTDTVRTLEISSNEESVIAEVAKRIGAIRYEKRKGCYSWIFLKDDTNGNQWYQWHDFSDLSDDLGCVFGQYSRNRRIPRIYMMGSQKQRMELLQGLMDADGCITGSDRINTYFSTKSERLASDVQELAASLGMRTSLSSNTRLDELHDGKPEYEVYFRIPVEMRRNLFYASCVRKNAFDDDMQQRVRRFNRHYDDMAIVDVEDMGYETDMTCIYVDSPTHLYLVGKEHIVTHNTALVQGTMAHDKNRLYLEVDLARMLAELHGDAIADGIKGLFGDAEAYGKNEDRELVLFMDEFHQIVQLSAAAVEAMKPMLADSGTRGIRVIAATTYAEFEKYISPNQPLVERLMRINLKQPDEEMTVKILKGMAKRYGVDNQFYDDHVFHLIYEYTNRYVPANSQPRKSILILDAMVGWYRLEHRKMDDKLLADVLYETEGVNVAFRVDATTIKKKLDEKVLAQKAASSAIESRMQICIAGLNDQSKPMSTFLFTGSTGTGKLISDYEPVPVCGDNGVYVKAHGDLVPGDMVFSRTGKPERIVAVFPHTDVPMYRVTFTDGRTLDVGDEHLWSVYTSKMRNKLMHGDSTVKPIVMTTKEIFDAGVVRTYKRDARRHLKYFIPMNGAVQWPERDYKLSPYALGVLIGNGSLTEPALTLSSSDEETTLRLVESLGAIGVYDDKYSYSHTFYMPFSLRTGRAKVFQTKDVLSEVPELIGVRSAERFIPEAYMHGSVEQRKELVRGLFDTDGTVSADDRVRVSYSTFSERLAHDVQYLLFSLGISSIVSCYSRTRMVDGHERDMTKYTVRVKLADECKPDLFKLSRKRECIYANMRTDKIRNKDFSTVGISDIQYIGRQSAQCIYVDDEEHLYQAGEFVVTHNTEMTKQLAKLLFDDERNLLRFDMTEYANPDSLERFRASLTSRVWERPYSIILLDEIEKSCSEVTRLLLQVLDDGRLTDSNGRETSFINSYIVMTTNAASEIYKTIAQYGEDDEGSGKNMKEFQKLIRRSIIETTGDNKFPPELIGRIDCMVPFQPLSENTMKRITAMKLKKLAEQVRHEHNVDVRFDKKVIDYLVLDNNTTDSDSGGARSVISKLESEVTTKLARFINKYPSVMRVMVKVEGETAYDNKQKRTSDAHIKVVAIG